MNTAPSNPDTDPTRRTPNDATGNGKSIDDDIPHAEDAFDIPEGEIDTDSLDIPILTDLHESDEEPSEDAPPPQNTASGEPLPLQPSLFQNLARPTTPDAEQIEHIVEELVFEYLPRLEHELRIRLYDYVSGLAVSSTTGPRDGKEKNPRNR